MYLNICKNTITFFFTFFLFLELINIKWGCCTWLEFTMAIGETPRGEQDVIPEEHGRQQQMGNWARRKGSVLGFQQQKTGWLKSRKARCERDPMLIPRRYKSIIWRMTIVNTGCLLSIHLHLYFLEKRKERRKRRGRGRRRRGKRRRRRKRRDKKKKGRKEMYYFNINVPS